MPLTLKSRFAGNVYVIRCTGSIVIGPEAKALEAAFDQAALEFQRIVLSLAELTRLDSIGLGLLVRYAATLRKRGGDIRIALPPHFVTKLLELTMLCSTLQVFPTEEDAILSFHRQRPVDCAPEKLGPRVLVVDESPDLCVFVRTVLQRRGFDVRTYSLFRDAEVLLQVDPVDYILVGPGTLQRPAEMSLKSLAALAPKAVPLRLDDDFIVRDAEQAADALLQLFKLQPGA
ncbi:MAG: STAS domain-containing protein [Acidobacteriaceae bacterium]|jgi:anti-anti-sigma factor